MNWIILRYGWFCFGMLFILPDLQAQEQCGTVLYNKGHNVDKFEQWIDARVQARRFSPQAKLSAEEADPIYRIPVVVHVIHRGEEVGVGSNIPFEQIEDQIRILNEDFRRLNPDSIDTPAEFQPVASDTRIEFVLARQTPDGFATNGVVRVQGPDENYGLLSGNTLAEVSWWDSELYLNIWVVPLRSPYLGFAQFPVSDLEGLEGASNNAQTDGVVIDYNFFGSIGNVVDRSVGRTTTHEVGHYLGLRHIWGDGDCSADDFVEDTPLQESDSEGCPAHPQTSCNSVDMFQNYMDYTNDRCMNLFTVGQRERMRIVLENSPRRRTLLTSPGLSEPIVLDDDAGISRINTPQRSECNGNIVPTITVVNAGNDPLTSFTVALTVQGNLREETTFSSNLTTGESTTVSFSPITLQGNAANARYSFSFFITSVNGIEDENATNNIRSVDFIIPQRAPLPLADDFESDTDNSLLNLGYLSNTDDLTTWELVSAPGYFSTENNALWLDFYNYDGGIGEQDILYTPIFDLAEVQEATLSFRYAYAPYQNENGEISNDGFAVGLSTNCGASYDTLLFEAYGEDLATAEPTGLEFIPSSRLQWRQVTIPLNAYLSSENLQISFIGYNDYGNNLYVDDISITAAPTNAVDLAITEVIAPSLLSCDSIPTPQVIIKNVGSDPVAYFEVVYQFDDQPATEFTYEAFPLEPGEEMTLDFDATDLSIGLHSFSVELLAPNLRTDDQPDDNGRRINFVVDNKQDIIPLVNEFQDYEIPDVLSGESVDVREAWQAVNPDSSITWQTAEAAGNGFNNLAAVIRNNQYSTIGARDLLVSPTLDFSNTFEASMFFQVSYGLLSENYVDTLNVLVSTDCGVTYELVYQLDGITLAAGITTDTEWIPQQESDWHQEFVDLSQFAGEPDVRVAFESVNGYGNTIYLDDIEFFISDDSEPISTDENSYKLFPNPTPDFLNVVFNLRNRETVMLAIYNSQGQTVANLTYPNTLNQTYDIDLSTFPRGVYILRVFSSTITDSKQFILQ
uniref:Choice-of-anchor J domain-containing protein n=1 Tax=Roseihalotalea indica TaxID=2867963 RepID=A0AA49JIU0_9BACT|nr:choice-of-anchor J domain-containing protein [Tunicatimonas sp. TK19036]